MTCVARRSCTTRDPTTSASRTGVVMLGFTRPRLLLLRFYGVSPFRRTLSTIGPSGPSSSSIPTRNICGVNHPVSGRSLSRTQERWSGRRCGTGGREKLPSTRENPDSTPGPRSSLDSKRHPPTLDKVKITDDVLLAGSQRGTGTSSDLTLTGTLDPVDYRPDPHPHP